MIVQMAIGILLMPFLIRAIQAIVRSKRCEQIAKEQEKRFNTYFN